MASRYLSSSQISRINALRQKHAILSSQLDTARKSISISEFYLTQLKKQKLLMKEKIQKIAQVAANQQNEIGETAN